MFLLVGWGFFCLVGYWFVGIGDWFGDFFFLLICYGIFCLSFFGWLFIGVFWIRLGCT